MEKNKQLRKEIEELKDGNHFWRTMSITIILIAFFSGLVLFQFQDKSYYEQINKLENQVDYLNLVGDCVIFPKGILFNVTASDCYSNNQKEVKYLEFCFNDICRRLK